MVDTLSRPIREEMPLFADTRYSTGSAMMMTKRVLLLVLVLVGRATTKRLRARLRYDGSRFHGVQKNVRTQDGTELRTIILTLEEQLWPALDQQVKFIMAGRTDAGVSATGQVCIFNVQGDEVVVNGAPVGVSNLAECLNTVLPSDLQMTEVVEVASDFDVVRDSRYKRYRYRLPPPRPDDDDDMRVLKMVSTHAARAARERQNGDAIPVRRLSRRQRRAEPPLAISELLAMSEAAALLEGTHDFGAFQAAGGDQKSTERTIFLCAIEPHAHGYDVVVEGDGFLRYMVRIIAGTLLMVGMGLAPPETIMAALSCDNRDNKSQLRRRGIVGPTLPPERLCLEHVEYDQ